MGRGGKISCTGCQGIFCGGAISQRRVQQRLGLPVYRFGFDAEFPSYSDFFSSHFFPFTVTPVAPSLSTLCSPLAAVISTILLQNFPVLSSDDSDLNSCCLLAEYLQLTRDGSSFADNQSPVVRSALNFIYDYEITKSNWMRSFTQPRLTRLASSICAQFVAICQHPMDLDTNNVFISSLDIFTQAFPLKDTRGKNPPVKADSNADALSAEELAASSKFIEKITSSSSSNTINSLLSTDLDEVWQSNGLVGMHWICIQLVDGVCAQDVGICVHNSDHNYCPRIISVRAANSMESLKSKVKVTIDYTTRVAQSGLHYLKALEGNTGMLTLSLV
jgi:hypothetical protein